MINNFLLKVFEQMSICRHFEQNVFNAVKNKQIIDLCGVGLIGSIKNKQTHTHNNVILYILRISH